MQFRAGATLRGAPAKTVRQRSDSIASPTRAASAFLAERRDDQSRPRTRHRRRDRCCLGTGRGQGAARLDRRMRVCHGPTCGSSPRDAGLAQNSGPTWPRARSPRQALVNPAIKGGGAFIASEVKRRRRVDGARTPTSALASAAAGTRTQRTRQPAAGASVTAVSNVFGRAGGPRQDVDGTDVRRPAGPLAERRREVRRCSRQLRLDHAQSDEEDDS